jgi:hypothetical protein
MRELVEADDEGWCVKRPEERAEMAPLLGQLYS